jgi:hypothetical protein
LSGVRIHRDSPLPDVLGARALAAGNDIAFARDAYLPGSAEGQQLIGHELAHVEQQSTGQTGLRAKGQPTDGYEQWEQAESSLTARMAMSSSSISQTRTEHALGHPLPDAPLSR